MKRSAWILPARSLTICNQRADDHRRNATCMKINKSCEKGAMILSLKSDFLSFLETTFLIMEIWERVGKIHGSKN